MSYKINFFIIFIIIATISCSLGCGSGSKNNNSKSSSLNSTPTHISGYGNLLGRIFDSAKVPVSNAKIEYSPDTSSINSTYSGHSDSNGYYSFEAPPGTGVIKVTGAGGTVIYEHIPVTVVQNGNTIIKFPEGQKAAFTLAQLNTTINETVTNNSRWGTVALTIPGSTEIVYFNFVINDKWVIKNTPIEAQPAEQNGQNITISFSLDLGVNDSTDVTSAQCSMDISSYILDDKPAGKFTSFIGEEQFIVSSGTYGIYEDIENARISNTNEFKDIMPGKYNNGMVYESTASHDLSKIPNQDCKKNECVLAAVSNSLRLLKNKFKLNIPESFMEINSLKKPLKWTSAGCDISKWISLKRNYTCSYIQTETTKDFRRIFKAIKEGKDVEIQGGQLDGNLEHVAMIVAITALDNGGYSIKIADDTKQDKDGGFVIREIKWYWGDNDILHGFWPAPYPMYFRKFVIESPN
ncbi:carboxypeptidase regulatory-like domain-containing protein [Candidatus Desantisbacteria bacterium]|nr:carboxypeptidase regulatory-like domain-containing protein [Candidatus Desantisbacteria bacterium]